MPLLGGLLLTLFTGLVEFLVKFFSQAVAIRLAFSALAVAAFATLYAVLVGLISSVAVSMPSWLVTAFAFVFPANVTVCLSAVLSCEAACMGCAIYLYELGLKSG